MFEELTKILNYSSLTGALLDRAPVKILPTDHPPIVDFEVPLGGAPAIRYRLAPADLGERAGVQTLRRVRPEHLEHLVGSLVHHQLGLLGLGPRDGLACFLCGRL